MNATIAFSGWGGVAENMRCATIWYGMPSIVAFTDTKRVIGLRSRTRSIASRSDDGSRAGETGNGSSLGPFLSQGGVRSVRLNT